MRSHGGLSNGPKIQEVEQEFAETEVASALYEKAIGGEYRIDKIFKLRNSDGSERVEVIPLIREIAPDFSSAAFWLKNRQPNAWKDRVEIESKQSQRNPLKEILDHVTARKPRIPIKDK